MFHPNLTFQSSAPNVALSTVFRTRSHLADVRWRALLPGKKSRVFHQVDEEVGGAVEHGEEVGQLGDVLDPVGPLQLTLHIEKIKSKSAESKTHKQSVVDPDLDPWDS
jgi:hypothetical protein